MMRTAVLRLTLAAMLAAMLVSLSGCYYYGHPHNLRGDGYNWSSPYNHGWSGRHYRHGGYYYDGHGRYLKHRSHDHDRYREYHRY